MSSWYDLKVCAFCALGQCRCDRDAPGIEGTAVFVESIHKKLGQRYSGGSIVLGCNNCFEEKLKEIVKRVLTNTESGPMAELAKKRRVLKIRFFNLDNSSTSYSARGFAG
mmetsp:Transcript_19406/g.47934  ORF Transcript_19406/g.47934 Transcript_19406/m.47934 type:complete len:110 (-) Transcript_19406:479-808(-)